MPIELIITFVRQVLLSVGAAAVTAGYLTNDNLTAIVGGITSVVVVVYGLLAKKATVEQVADLQQDKAVLKQRLNNTTEAKVQRAYDDPSSPIGGVPGGY